jgi:hypothetical protein
MPSCSHCLRRVGVLRNARAQSPIPTRVKWMPSTSTAIGRRRFLEVAIDQRVASSQTAVQAHHYWDELFWYHHIKTERGTWAYDLHQPALG